MIGHSAKRAIDVAVCGVGLLLAAPVMAAIAVAIKIDSRGPVFFVQDRIGLNGRSFKMLKFRTMREAPILYNSDGSTRVEPNDERVTRVGRLLRGALDELPQLVNILRGEMSLVGPRPEMASQRHLYRPGDERKLSVRPGLTSLAVLHGRNDIPWTQRVAIDVRYVEHWTLWLDLKILTQTILMPLRIRLFDFGDLLGHRDDLVEP